MAFLYHQGIMKLTFRQIEPFVKSPDPKARVVLVYGPDNGLMRERAKTIGLSIVNDYSDPFNVAVLSAEQLADDPARLIDEAHAISMMGGGRLIRIENAGDKLTTLIKDYLKDPSEHNLVILEAGELGPRSSLRKACESSKNAAALPCYVEDERDLSRLIRDTLQEANINIEPDAMTWLAVNISGNRQKVRSELEKLITYKGSETTPLTLVDAQAACGAAGVDSLDTLVYSAGGGRPKEALKAYDTLLGEGVPFITMLRSLQNHFRRLHVAKSRMERGESPEAAMKKLAPPIFFKQESAFKAQLQRWSLPVLAQTGTRLAVLEAQCKQTGAPVETLCSQALLSISKSAR